ncbi:MAG: tRNA (adenosine(37)-N6)-threonylcarbamoyltransferase complex ATPase subunit type 1 TsaE [Flavitalea sp.]
MEQIFKLESIEAVADDFLETFRNVKVFAFHGEMGAGKTTFITKLSAALGVTGSVSSPTFSIINEYSTGAGKIYHLDLYRLKSTEEAVLAGVEDVLFSGNTCFVEWPEKAPELLPEQTLHVYITLIDRETRKISATA